MTVISRSSKMPAYIGTGLVDTYSITIQFLLPEHVQATLIDLEEAAFPLEYGVDYVVNKDSKTLKLLAGPLALDHQLVISRMLPLTQEASIRNQGPFYPDVIENQLDRMVMIDQQQQDQIDNIRTDTLDAQAAANAALAANALAQAAASSSAASAQESAQSAADALLAAQAAQTAAEEASTWWTGQGAPDASLGDLNDYYLDTDTGDYFAKLGDPAVWTFRASLRGPDGADSTVPGPPGADGADGQDGADGADGADGQDGADGPAGPGVAEGGTAGQILGKASDDDFDTEWIDPPTSLPPGGTEGQVLTKGPGGDGDANWEDPQGGGALPTPEEIGAARAGANSDLTALNAIAGRIATPMFIQFKNQVFEPSAPATGETIVYVSQTGELRKVNLISGDVPIGGGGDGGAAFTPLILREGPTSAQPLFLHGRHAYRFAAGAGQKLFSCITVAEGFRPGSNIRLRMTGYAPDFSGSIQVKVTSTLQAPGVGQVGDPAPKSEGLTTESFTQGQERTIHVWVATGGIIGVTSVKPWDRILVTLEVTTAQDLHIFTDSFGVTFRSDAR